MTYAEVPRRSSGFRILGLMVLTLLLAFCCYEVWERRAAWVIVATEPGFIPGGCGQDTSIPWIHDPNKATVLFPDTGQRIQLPPGLQMGEIRNFTPDRRLLVFHESRLQGYVVLNLETGRLLSFPGFQPDEVFPTTDGTRLTLQHDPSKGLPREYQTHAIDGRLLHSRLLPPLEPPWKVGWMTWDGTYVVETGEEGKAPLRIHAMAGGEPSTFDDRLVEVQESGRAWLLRGKVLRAYDLQERKELWTTSFAEDVVDARLLDPARLLVRAGDQSLSLYDAARGQRLATLEEGEQSGTTLYWHQRRPAGPRLFLQTSERIWDLETARLLSWKFPESFIDIDFFADGRRALLLRHNEVPAVVDVDTGQSLFRFVSGPADVEEGDLIRGIVAGSKVVTTSRDDKGQVAALIWQRRHPEGLWGHLLRPEVYGAVFFGVLLLVALLTRRGR